jgi:hypothetical protein
MQGFLAATAVSTLLAAAAAAGQSIQIGIIDFYGLNGQSPDRARAALPFKEGDDIPPAGGQRAAWVAAAEARIAKAIDVARARVNLVCCDKGRAVVFIGIEPRGSPGGQFRPAPTGNDHLAADIVEAGAEFSKAMMLAVQRGDAAEDRSQGHALNHDAAMRAIQVRFVAYAKRDLLELRRVLRHSSDATERALAAQVLGYAPDKSAIIDDLVHAMSDPAEGVRNDAMRALLVIAEMTPGPGQTVPRIPPQPFIALLSSPIWTDRNKTSGALAALTASRDPQLLDAMKEKSVMTALAEMARWKSLDHAMAPFLALARVAGYSDDTALGLWARGDREVVIKAALTRVKGDQEVRPGAASPHRRPSGRSECP